uniref:Breast carcinoma-amplified sequence 3 n=1 Tax=Ditylenchus dipsaci TaxID=166011 RepID=A0A915EEG5_9BILA
MENFENGLNRHLFYSMLMRTNFSAPALGLSRYPVPHTMSISQHGKQQKQRNSSSTNGNSTTNKKNQGLSTAAVYPIIQPKVQKTSVLPEVASNNVANDLASRISSIRGQCVRPNPVVEHTIVTSVAEFVSEVIPQGNAQSIAQSELIYWVKIQKCSCEFRSRMSTFVMVVGLARGYQVWMMLENGECEEVISERKGPLKVGHMLPFTTNGNDRFRDHRPLFALVDGNPMSSTSQENKFCSVSFVSLKRGKTVHTLEFDNPIVDIESSSECLLIVFNESIVICDHESLCQRHCVVVPAPEDSLLIPCYALSDNLLAFVENKLNKAVQSCGGTLPEEELSYGGQVMSAAKTISKTVSSISESFVSSFSSIPQNNKNNSNEISNSGIVSVINVNSLPQANESANLLQHYMAHFMAHDSAAIGYLAFGNGGQLLLTSTQTSTVFHIFLLHPHPTSPKLGSVQHIYTLNRGNSAAKVLQSAFSADNRWLAISTNHGTTHLFAISPFGVQSAPGLTAASL